MKGFCIIGAISHNFKKELYVHCTKSTNIRYDEESELAKLDL